MKILKHHPLMTLCTHRPLLVSLLLYLNDTWPRHFDAETLFLDCSEDVGILVRPKVGELVNCAHDHWSGSPNALS